VTNTTDPVLPLSDRAIEALDRFLCTAFPPPRRVPDRFHLRRCHWSAPRHSYPLAPPVELWCRAPPAGSPV